MSAFRPCTAAQANTQALVVGTAASSITLAFAPSGAVPISRLAKGDIVCTPSGVAAVAKAA
ncbi:MAG: hypothetical protein B7X10_05810 [Burkholderiales bacterium 21-58-4]|nr:MAG: hypothetical protein B7X10_05810 [Burkholderiales bacterium 21-58-4]